MMKYIYLLASLFLVFTLPAQVEYNAGGLTAALDSIFTDHNPVVVGEKFIINNLADPNAYNIGFLQDNNDTKNLRMVISGLGIDGVSPFSDTLYADTVDLNYNNYFYGAKYNDLYPLTCVIDVLNNGGTMCIGDTLPCDQLYGEEISTGNSTVFALGVSFQLPVQWSVPCKAQIINKQAYVTWSVAQQRNTMLFEIEQSLDGVHFNKVGTTQGDGVLYAERSFAFAHANPVVGKNYYRIKQVDFDGQYSYSNIAYAAYYLANQVALYPNPASDIVRITLKNLDKVQVYDIFGRFLFSQPLTVGENQVSVEDVPAGLYCFRFESGSTQLVAVEKE